MVYVPVLVLVYVLVLVPLNVPVPVRVSVVVGLTLRARLNVLLNVLVYALGLKYPVPVLLLVSVVYPPVPVRVSVVCVNVFVYALGLRYPVPVLVPVSVVYPVPGLRARESPDPEPYENALTLLVGEPGRLPAPYELPYPYPAVLPAAFVLRSRLKYGLGERGPPGAEGVREWAVAGDAVRSSKNAMRSPARRPTGLSLPAPPSPGSVEERACGEGGASVLRCAERRSASAGTVERRGLEKACEVGREPPSVRSEMVLRMRQSRSRVFVVLEFELELVLVKVLEEFVLVLV